MAASLDFDGTNDYVNLGAIDILSGETQFTIIAQANDNVLTTGNQCILGNYDSLNAFDENLLMMYRSTPQIFLALRGTDGTSDYIKTSGLTFSANTWYNWAWTWDASVSAQLLGGSKFYKDGEDVTLINHVGGTDVLNNVQSTNGLLQIGRRLAVTDTWNGQIAYLRIYNRALTQDEIKDSIYEPEAIADGLVGYWPLWTTACKDLSGNGNDGTVVNTVVASDDGPPVYFPELETV